MPKEAKADSTKITIDFKNHPETLAAIKVEAAKDERGESAWLRRQIVAQFKVTK
jgi:hypothetical protein